LVGCYIWYTARRGLGGATAHPGPLLVVPNVTAYPSTASVPITVLQYNGPVLICALNGLWIARISLSILVTNVVVIGLESCDL